MNSIDESAPVTSGDLSHNGSDDRAFHDSQVHEYNKIVKSMRLIHKTDDLDTSIALTLESITQEPPKIGAAEYTMEDTLDIIHGLPPVEEVNKPEFFNRKTLPFRLLRRSLELHLVNPIKPDDMASVPLSNDDREDPRLFEHIWFLLFLGAAPDAIAENLQSLRNSRGSRSQSVILSDNKETVTHLRTQWSKQVPSIQNVRSPQYVREGTSTPPLEQLPTHVAKASEEYIDKSTRHPRMSNPTPEPAFSRSKKAQAVVSYFRDRLFRGSPEQSVNNLIRDYEICASQQSLDSSEMSLFFINSLADPAREFFLSNCSPNMPFNEIVTRMYRHYNSETRKLQLQSEMDSLDLRDFMRKRSITDFSVGLVKICNHINALASQLPSGFGNDAHKTRYLRRAVMRFEWAKQPISMLTTSRYSFTQFLNALQEGLQLNEELARTNAQEMNYGQYLNNPHDVRYPNNPKLDPKNDYSPRKRNSRSPHGYPNISTARPGSRNRSPSPYNPSLTNDYRHRQNPSLPRKRYCYGCGSPDHILSDRRCTPTLQSIRMNLINTGDYQEVTAEELATQFMTLFATLKKEPVPDRAEAPLRTDFIAPGRSNEEKTEIKFQESLYHVEESDTFQSHIEAATHGKIFDMQYATTANPPIIHFDTSNTLFSDTAIDKYPGFCVDIGAPRSVIGSRTISALLKKLKHKSISKIPSGNSFRFGDVTVPSMGIVELWLKVPSPRRSIPVLIEIVEVNVPALLGLDVLDSEQLYACNVTNQLFHRQILSKKGDPLIFVDKWSTPLTRHDNHLYAEMAFPSIIFYTTAQLRKFHHQFAHPSAGKLYNLLKKAGLEAVDANTLETLEKITAQCEPCQRIRNAPLRFKVAMGHEDIRFNSRVYIDIMYLDGRPVLHIVDESTRFSAARFLTKMTTDAVWEAIVLCWSSVYTGLPQCMMVDEGAQFRNLFAELTALHDIKLEKSGVQSHNSLGVGERYHKPLRDTYLKLKLDHPSMQRQLLLALATKAMNDTLGPEGYVPSSLVFGEFPSLRTFEGPLVPRPTLAERAEAALEARRYMSKHLAQVRVKGALNHHIPPATKCNYQPGDKVLIWREKQVENRIGQWVGPYVVISTDEVSRIVLVQLNSNSPYERYHITQVKHFIEEATSTINFLRTINATLHQFSSKSRETALEEDRHVDDYQMRLVAVTQGSMTSTEDTNSHHKRLLSQLFHMKHEDVFATHATEVIEETDPRAHNDLMNEAIKGEVASLVERGTFKVIKTHELPDDANLLTARFVLAIKTDAQGNERYKARYVVGGHRDNMKNYLVHGSQTLQKPSCRLLLALASMHEFDVWLTDVKLAYVQSTEPMTRRVFIRNPASQFGLAPDECFELIRPLYGLSDAGDLWHRTMHKHLVDELDHFSTKVDMSMYISIRHGELDGISGVYVDDVLRTGTPNYRSKCSKTHEKFDTTGDEEPPLTFSGFHITKPANVPFSMDQTFYIKNVEELNLESNFYAFRSMRMKLAWLASTRPDMLFEISQLAQVTEDRFNNDAKAHIKRLNSSTRYAHNNVAHLLFPKLDRDSIRLVGYSDAAFANNYDLTSQLGRIILLIDKHDNAIPIVFKSYKSRRVTRSVLSAEVIAFADLFDDSFAIRSQLEEATCRAVPMHLMTDSKSLFDVISKGSRTNEKRIMIDIYSARKAYQVHEISNIGFVRSQNNIADGLTKPKMQSALLHLLLTGKHQVKCEQWIIRPH